MKCGKKKTKIYIFKIKLDLYPKSIKNPCHSIIRRPATRLRNGQKLKAVDSNACFACQGRVGKSRSASWCGTTLVPGALDVMCGEGPSSTGVLLPKPRTSVQP